MPHTSNTSLKRLLWGLGVTIAALLPALIHGNFINSHFYGDAPWLLDSGFVADLIWRNSWELICPSALSPDGAPHSFLRTHPAFNLSMFSELSYLFNFEFVTWFAIYTGGTFGLIGLFVFLICNPSVDRPLSILTAALLSIAVTFCPISLHAASYPHYELFAVAMAAGWIWAVCSGHRLWSWLFFILALSTREDVGLHLAGLIMVILVGDKLFPRDSLKLLRGNLRELRIFACVAMLYSVGMLIFMRLHYSEVEAMTRIYAGSPPYAHLTLEFFLERLSKLTADRYDIIAIAGFLTLTSVVVSSFLPVAGVLAFVPWVIFSLSAIAIQAGTISLYYGFPLLIGFIFSLQMLARIPQERTRAILLWIGIAIFLIPTFTMRSSFDRFMTWAFTVVPREQIHEIRAFRNYVREISPRDPEIKVDISVAALEPRAIPTVQNQIDAPDFFKNTQLVIFHGKGFRVKESDDRCVQIGTTYFYRWMNTSYVIASKIPLENVGLRSLTAKRDPSIRPSGLLK